MKPKFLPLAMAACLLLASSCRKTEKSQDENDFQKILETGEINVLTMSGSMSYFIYKGEERGYEYEILKSFADSYGLKINIKLAENETKLAEMLDEKEGDLVAYNIPVTNEGKEHYLYCGQEAVNEMVLVQRSNRGDTILKDVTELIGKDVWSIDNSKYFNRIHNLNDEVGGGINIHTIEEDSITVEDLIEMVSKGQIPYTVSDADMAKLNRTYYRNIDISLVVGHPQRSSWAVRKSNPALAEAINIWFQENISKPAYKQINKRYFEMSKMPGDEPAPILGKGQISPFDALFRKYARTVPVDWRLMASIAYQESKFHTNLVSWAGASGVMGLMPKTASSLGLSADSIFNPDDNIRIAAQLIRRLNKIFNSIDDEPERIKFILAAYNAGSGHVADARALAEKYGSNPNNWAEVEEFLKLKSLPEYYSDPVCKSGYLRGTETLNYVRSVGERYAYYCGKVKE
ncbi:MAG: transglycosylase SLT domain-containing protein [Dysgonamonadaceae bacterium]|jgi:membrane-bound lytic murein transglycosylase F|nr:transglycosylase SLT domain-containing protein [Dysgonamonadaceae bacterium]